MPFFGKRHCYRPTAILRNMPRPSKRYPEARHRRQYIDDAISKGTPCFGRKVLGSLMAAGKVNCVFTTNFDPLVEESAHSANGILPVCRLTVPQDRCLQRH